VATIIRLEAESVWDGLEELNSLDGVGIRSLDIPDRTQLNNEIAISGAVIASAAFVFLKFGQHAVTAVRDVIVKQIESRHAKVQITAGKHKIVYEGNLSVEQSNQLLNDLKVIAEELGK